MFPLLTKAQVISHDPRNHAVNVLLPSGQMVPFPVLVLAPVNDAARISQRPLPARGSWGIVGFPQGDVRSGVWLGAFSPNLMNASTSSEGEPFNDYESHWSGFWRILNEQGEMAAEFPDGTSIVVSASGALPVTYRNVVDENQAQQRKAFTREERVPNPPAPYKLIIRSAQGVDIRIEGGVVHVEGSGTPLRLMTEDAYQYLVNHVHSGITPGGSNTGAPVGAWPATSLTSTLKAE